MLPANLLNALQALSSTGRQQPQTTPDAPKRVANLELGQQVQGSVQAKISEGLFKVQVAGQTLQMRLPVNIRPGDTVKLEVVSLQPRITFGMAASTNPLSTPEQIGSAARLLSNLAERPIERPVIQQFGSKAVWPAGQQASDTKLLAGALREALGKSGLFYESHQAQWVRGERSINQLLEEPQNRLMGKGSPLASGDQQTATDRASPAQAGAPVQAKAAADAAQPIAKELVHLVQQQLHTLEQHHLVWQGQVWPGQQMQWEIQGQPENQARQQDERQWSTEMELSLPRLGDVHARLVLAEGGLRVVLRAADRATAVLFNRALPGLGDSLTNAGVPLAAAVVEEKA